MYTGMCKWDAMADLMTDRASPRAARPEDLSRLIATLRQGGWQVIGPRPQDGAVVLAPLDTLDDLPIGLTEQQEAGTYRLVPRTDKALFGYRVGPHSWKRFLHPDGRVLWQGRRDAAGAMIYDPPDPLPSYAFLGARACDLAAMGILDGILPQEAERPLILAVSCSEAGGTCFCASVGTGPAVTADSGADLALTEVLEEGEAPALLLEVFTPAGAALVESAGLDQGPPAPPALIEKARAAVAGAAAHMGRRLQTEGLAEALAQAHDHSHWHEVAARCLTCANCTLVCPTCFCSTVEDHTSLMDETLRRVERWDSCFTLDFSRLVEGPVRRSAASRYRQWLTHKLSHWVDQFGTLGCVGCGRCITWCPVGIDLTAEAAVLRDIPPVAPRPTPPVVRPAPEAFSFPKTAHVVERHVETADTVTLVLDLPNDPWPGFAPGQFNMLYADGLGEAAISLSGDPADPQGRIVHTIRAVGPTSAALVALQPGDFLGLRGPFGASWPLPAEGTTPLVIAGGLGLAPLRPLLSRLPQAPVIVGARTPETLIFAEEMGRRQAPVFQIVEEADTSWSGPLGRVTDLLDSALEDPAATTAYVCGPEAMMAATGRALLRRGVAAERIFVSLERNMKCAVGTCGHCQLGPHFVCKDGPVFPWSVIAPAFEREEW